MRPTRATIGYEMHVSRELNTRPRRAVTALTWAFVVEILLVLGLLMAAVNIAGGLIGARMAVRKGNAFVRKVFLLVVSVLALKLGWDTVATVL